MFNSTPSMPNVTHVQILAGVLWVASQAVAYGWISHTPNQEVLSGAATVIAIGLAWADAHLRGKRAIAHAILNQPVAVVTPQGSATDPTSVQTVVSQPLGV